MEFELKYIFFQNGNNTATGRNFSPIFIKFGTRIAETIFKAEFVYDRKRKQFARMRGSRISVLLYYIVGHGYCRIPFCFFANFTVDEKAFQIFQFSRYCYYLTSLCTERHSALEGESRFHFYTQNLIKFQKNVIYYSVVF